MLNKNTLSSSPVQVKQRSFWCGDIPFVAYQLPKGEIAMSKTLYLPYFSKRLQRIASSFVARYNLPIVQGILPGNSIITLFPLATVIELWDYFLSIDELRGRKELFDAISAKKPIVEASPHLPRQLEDTVAHSEQLAPQLAECMKLQIERFILSLLIEQDRIYISDTVGLSIINAPLNWLLGLNPAMKKARSLKKNGFSFQTKTLYYANSNHLTADSHLDEEIIQDITPPETDSLTVNIVSCQARLWSDWVILWEYFSGKGNTQSLALLKHLAIQGLEYQIEPLLPTTPTPHDRLRISSEF
jgi:hypothetical protein